MDRLKKYIKIMLLICLFVSKNITCYAEEFDNTVATTETVTTEISTTETTTTEASTEKKTNNTEKSTEKKESEQKDNKKEKKKTTKKKRSIPMPKRKVTVKGCDSIRKRILTLEKEKKGLEQKIIVLDNKKKGLKEFENRFGDKLELYGQLKTDHTVMTPRDLEMQDQIRSLGKLLKDKTLMKIADQYVFGIRLDTIADLQDPESKAKTIDLSAYLKKTYIAPTKSMKNKIKKINIQIEEEEKTRLFDPKDVSSISNITVKDAKKMLSGTALQKNAASFVKAERIYHVNAVFLMAIAAHESAWGTSRRAIEDNNLTGYGVYSDSAKGINKKTKEEGLLATAATLHERYLTKGGTYYEGTSVAAINKHYCTSDDWAAAVVQYGYNLMEKM